MLRRGGQIQPPSCGGSRERIPCHGLAVNKAFSRHPNISLLRKAMPHLIRLLATFTLVFNAGYASAEQLWSVDLQGTGSPATMTGPEATFGLGNVWNALNVGHHPA